MKTALLFAAGRGERMRPITDRYAKPLCEVGGISIIERLIHQLEDANFTHIVINHAYLGSQIKHHINKKNFNLQISFSPEPPGALETAGGLMQALPLLGKEPFITIGSDIVTDFPFKSLALRNNFPIHLVLVPKQKHTPNGDFGLENQIVLDTPKTHTFGCIACFTPDLFTDKTLKRLRLADFMRSYIEAKQVSGECYQGKWIDIGSTERLKEAQSIFPPNL
ncbi:MAG: hypothetical protein A3F18_06740 [Legionellales bacterium RIFCSPHIGHO2_12_FULL_37_14]|nr:MAG: hypothetical protein A3F18_06740 [Legionellales bacterium RIFCSPHIGHO2_12_FULL_37_14]